MDNEKDLRHRPSAEIIQTLVVVFCVLSLTAPSLLAGNGDLYHVDPGNGPSEKTHNLEAKGSRVMDFSDLPSPDVRITDMTASVHQNNAVKTIDGEGTSRWGAPQQPKIWIQYELSKSVEMDQVRMKIRDTRHFIPIEIKVGNQESDLKRVFSGKTKPEEGASGGTNPKRANWKTYRFEPTEGRYVRIVLHEGTYSGAHGKQLWLWEVRLDGLKSPDAYARARNVRAFGEAGRRLLNRANVEAKLGGKDWMGGWMRFDIATDPHQQNYVTLKMFGSQRSNGGLALMAGTKKKGGNYRWISKPRGAGDSSVQSWQGQVLWLPNWQNKRVSQRLNGRWIYRTYPLPYDEFTKGRKHVRLRIQQYGFGKPPTIYRVYSHTNPRFIPPSDEPQGDPFEWGEYRGDAELDVSKKELKKKGKTWAENIMTGGGGNLDQLSQMFTTKWSGYHRDKELLQRAAEILDRKAKTYAKNGSISRRWAEAGRAVAKYYIKLHDGFENSGLLDETIALAEGGKQTRRKAYVQMFKGEFDAFHKKRRSYTNQTYFGNAGLYYLNRVLLELRPDAALPEAEGRWIAYELMGMVPFGTDLKAYYKKRMDAGYPYTVVTDKGLTRELGYVADYGEMTPLFARFARNVGDPRLKERVEQMVRARVHFRLPDRDKEGFRMLRKIGVLSHRHHHYPAKTGRKAHFPLWRELRALKDPVSKRMCELWLKMKGHDLDSTSSLPIRNVKQRLVYKEMPPSEYRMPFEEEKGDDYAWADEENAVFMIHDNDQLIWGSFYMWGARKGFNRRGRIRHVTSVNDRVVDIVPQTRAPVGKWVPLRMNMPDGHKYIPAQGNYIVPPSPPGIKQAKNAQEHTDNGRLWYYQFEYGDYLIAMNTTRSDAYNASLYELDIPEEHRGKTVKDLITGRTVDLSNPVVVGPRSTMVLYVGGT